MQVNGASIYKKRRNVFVVMNKFCQQSLTCIYSRILLININITYINITVKIYNIILWLKSKSYNALRY